MTTGELRSPSEIEAFVRDRLGPDLQAIASLRQAAARRSGQATIGDGVTATVVKSVTVAHGLPSTPAKAQATASHEALNCGITTLDDTNITITVRHTDGATWTGPYTVYWEVTGG